MPLTDLLIRRKKKSRRNAKAAKRLVRKLRRAKAVRHA